MNVVVVFFLFQILRPRAALQQTVRKQIVQQFLVYRARNCRERERWAAILDESFVFTIPITPFRSFHRNEIQGSHRVVRGIDAMMGECASLALMAESIGLGSAKWRQAIKRYTSSLKDYFCSERPIFVSVQMKQASWCLLPSFNVPNDVV
jgi:hypothetical protein